MDPVLRRFLDKKEQTNRQEKLIYRSYKKKQFVGTLLS